MICRFWLPNPCTLLASASCSCEAYRRTRDTQRTKLSNEEARQMMVTDRSRLANWPPPHRTHYASHTSQVQFTSCQLCFDPTAFAVCLHFGFLFGAFGLNLIVLHHHQLLGEMLAFRFCAKHQRKRDCEKRKSAGKFAHPIPSFALL